MKYILWHITHGVELNLSNDYAQNHILKVKRFLPETYRDYIIPISTNWNNIVHQKQIRTWEIEKDLSLPKMRKICVEIACDLLWYHSSKKSSKGLNIYDEIHNKLEFELSIFTDRYHGGFSIVREGHSLGSQIMLDACFESKFKTDGLITIGSPITKYSGMFSDWGHLPDRPLDWWINLYNSRDLVSSSFKNHPSKSFNGFIEDFNISTYNPFNKLILRAHKFYWNDTDVCKIIADRLIKHLIVINRVEKI